MITLPTFLICTVVNCETNIRWEIFTVVQIRARGYKTFFMLNSVEHKILNAHKYKNIKKFSYFQAQIDGECYFSSS